MTTKTPAQLFLFLVAATFALFGIVALVAPAEYAAAVDLAIRSDHARTEIRTTYGGLNLALGLLLAYAAADPARTRFGLAAGVIIGATMGLVRSYGIAMDGTRAAVQTAFAAMELGGAAIACVFLRKSDDDIR